METLKNEMAENTGSSANNRNKFKKRKKFMANAKGFGKMGNFGRGTRLEGEEWSYYINIMDAIKEGFDSLDDKLTMADNVFEQTIGKEIHISSNQIACTIIEYLLPFTNTDNFERFQQAFADNFRPICSDKFASHILQNLVEISFLRAVSTLQPKPEEPTQLPNRKRKLEIPSTREYNLTTEFKVNHIDKCIVFVERASKFLMNNLEDFVWDPYASHVIRTCFMSLSGLFVPKSKDFITTTTTGGNFSKSQPIDPTENPLQVPDSWNDILKEYATRLQAWPQFNEFPFEELSSGLLQSLVMALKVTDKNALKHLGKRILKESFSSIDETDSLPKVFSSVCSIRLLETLLTAAGPKLFNKLYMNLCHGRLIPLSEHKSGNFVVQKLLDNVNVKEDFEAMFDELSPNIENLLRIGHTSVVNALCQACLRLCAKQGGFMQCIQTALHCNTNNANALNSILKLKPHEIAVDDKSNFIHLHGSLILQAMLRFNKPIKWVQSLLDMDSSDLAELLCNAKGSHIGDAFMQSKTIGEKSREKFVRHLEKNYLPLALSKYGSRALECVYEASHENQKMKIVKELSEKVNQLNSTPTGRLLNYKFRVETYRKNPAQWKASFNKEAKIQKLFDDIIKE